VLPDAHVVRYEIDVKRVLRGKLKLVIADGRTFVDDRLIYEAKDLRVGLFQTTEGF
jgi:3-hydroxyacyl-[acyl-carrier protein] dehydratase / trans-2-decenoyl-[acyl-carrier protein] isomerase